MNIEIRAESQLFNRGIELYGLDPKSRLTVKAPLDWVEWQEETKLEPMAVLTITNAQQLMDDLWKCGIRPSEGSGAAGQAAAMREHIEFSTEMARRLLTVIQETKR